MAQFLTDDEFMNLAPPAPASGRKLPGRPLTDDEFMALGTESAPRASQPARERTWGEALTDTGVQLAEGVNTTLGAIPNLVAPEGRVAQFFNDNAQYWRDKQSETLKTKIAQADQAITAAGEDGVMAQIAEAAGQYFSDPALAARFVFTNLPSMIPGIGAAKLAQAAQLARGASAARAAAAATTAAGATNAALNAGGARGEAFEDIKRTLIAQGMAPEEAEQKALEDSRIVAAIGALAGYVSGKTGLEKGLFGQATTRGALRAGVASGTAELTGEQIEEVAPQIATNLQAGQYDNRSALKNVGRTIVETAIGAAPGAVLAGGVAATNRTASDTEPQGEPTTRPALPAPQKIVFPDGTVANSLEDVERYLGQFPEEERVARRAQLLGYGPQPAEPEQQAPLPALPNPGEGADAEPRETLEADAEGTVRRRGESAGQPDLEAARRFEQSIAELPEAQQIEARARYYGYGQQSADAVLAERRLAAPDAARTEATRTVHVDTRGVAATEPGAVDQRLAEIERSPLPETQKTEQAAQALGLGQQETEEARLRRLAEESNKKKSGRGKAPAINTRDLEQTPGPGVYRRATEDGRIEYLMPNVPGASLVLSQHPSIPGHVIDALEVPPGIKGKSAENVRQLLLQAAMAERPLVRRAGKKFEAERALVDRVAGAASGRLRPGVSLVGSGQASGRITQEIAAYKARREQERQAQEQAAAERQARAERASDLPLTDEETHLVEQLRRALAAKVITPEEHRSAKAALEMGEPDEARSLLEASARPEVAREVPEPVVPARDLVDEAFESRAAVRDSSQLSQKDDSLPIGGAVEVAPNPANKQATEQFAQLPIEQRARITRRVAGDILPRLFAQMGLAGRYILGYTTGGYLGRTNPSVSITFDADVSYEQAREAMTAAGVLLNQQSVVVIDESVREGENVVGVVRLEPSRALSAAEAEALFSHIYAATGGRVDEENTSPASGYTAKDGGLLFLNFSGLSEEQLRNAIERAIADFDGFESPLEVHVRPGRIRSELVYTDERSADNGESKTDVGAAQTAGRALVWRGAGWFDSLMAESEAIFQRAFEQERRAGGRRADGRGEGDLPAHARENRQGADGGLVRTPSYGEPRDGAISVTGVHYSKEQRSVLISDFYGTGLQGAEAARLAQATDARLRSRTYFYVNEGQGVSPEAGVGSHAHRVTLNNLYDAEADPLNLKSLDMNAFELAVVNAGFDGYYVRARFGKQGVAVALGRHAIPIEYLGAGAEAKAKIDAIPAPAKPAESEGQQLARRIIENKALPAGEVAASRWIGYLERLATDIYGRLDQLGVIDWLRGLGEERLYKSDLAVQAKQAAEQGGLSKESRTKPSAMRDEVRAHKEKKGPAKAGAVAQQAGRQRDNQPLAGNITLAGNINMLDQLKGRVYDLDDNLQKNNTSSAKNAGEAGVSATRLKIRAEAAAAKTRFHKNVSEFQAKVARAAIRRLIEGGMPASWTAGVRIGAHSDFHTPDGHAVRGFYSEFDAIVSIDRNLFSGIASGLDRTLAHELAHHMDWNPEHGMLSTRSPLFDIRIDENTGRLLAVGPIIQAVKLAYESDHYGLHAFFDYPLARWNDESIPAEARAQQIRGEVFAQLGALYATDRDKMRMILRSGLELFERIEHETSDARTNQGRREGVLRAFRALAADLGGRRSGASKNRGSAGNGQAGSRMEGELHAVGLAVARGNRKTDPQGIQGSSDGRTDEISQEEGARVAPAESRERAYIDAATAQLLRFIHDQEAQAIEQGAGRDARGLDAGAQEGRRGAGGEAAVARPHEAPARAAGEEEVGSRERRASPAPITRREALQALRRRAEQMLGSDARIVTFVDQLFSPKDGAPISGLYARDLITVAMNADDALGTLDHETMHHAMEVYYTPAQRQVLRIAFKPGGALAERVRQALRADGQGAVAEDTGYLARDDEYITFGFQYWKRGQVQFRGQVGQLFQTFADFLERVRNWLKGAGFNTAEDLFRMLDEGRLAGRRQGEASAAGAKEARRLVRNNYRTIHDFVVPETPEFEGNTSGDLAVIEQSVAEESGGVVKALPIRLYVGKDDGYGSHRGYGALHLLRNGQRNPARASPVETGDAIEDAVRHAITTLRNARRAYIHEGKLVLYSVTAGKAVVLTEARRDGETFYSIVTVRPAPTSPAQAEKLWGEPVWVGRRQPTSVGSRDALPRQLYPDITDDSAAQSEKDSLASQTEPLTEDNITATGPAGNGSKTVVITQKKRRVVPDGAKESRARPGAIREELRRYKEKLDGQKAKPKTLIGRLAPSYERRAKAVIDALDRFLDPLGKLPDPQAYLTERYRTLGAIARYEEIAKDIYDTLAKASKDDAQALYDYLTTAGATTSAIKDRALAQKAVEVKGLIDRVGQALVKRGLLSQEAYQRHKDSYLPRLYLKYLLDDSQEWRMGTGRKTSDQGYLKSRKDIPEEVRRVFLGEVQDPAFLSAVGITRAMRDLFILHWLEQISQNQQWVLPQSLVEWNGKRVSAHWLKAEADRLRRQADHYDEQTAKQAHALAVQMDEVADQALADISGHPLDDYKQVPNSHRYGMLRGMWVRKEIHADIVGLGEMKGDGNWIASLFGYGGAGTKLTQLWKAGKVSLNPSAQIRNFVSNMVLLQLSGVPLHRIPALFGRAVREIGNDGRYWQVAKKYGVTESTFSSQELFRMKKELLDLEERTRGLTPFGFMRKAASWLAEVAGNAYEKAEAVGKTMKIIDAMEREKLDEAAAALEAQRWLFDYSLVPNSVRYARNMPVGGAPFLCVDDKTEALTKEGWKGIDEIKEGDFVASFNMQSERLEWKPVDFVYRDQYDGPMVHVEDRHLDMLLTPHHRCVTYRRARVPGRRQQGETYLKLGIVHASDLNTRDHIPVAAPFARTPAGEPISDAVVRVLGWVVTEGSLHQKCASVRLSQNANKAEMVRDALRAAGMTWSEHSERFKNGNDDHVMFLVHAEHGRLIRELLPNKQLTPQLLNRLTTNQIRLLIETMIDGDGCRSSDNPCFVQKKGETAEAFKMALVLAGYSFGVHDRGNGVETITIRKGTRYSVKRAKIESVPYSGRIWCPSVPGFTTWVARRNGKVFITGNTFWYKVAPRLVEVALHHPQRFLPWVILWWGLAQLAASALGADDEELEAWKKSLPEWLRNRSHLAVLPYRDAQGRIQVADLGYFFPWTMFVEAGGAVARGDFMDLLRSMGLLGGPMTDLIIAMRTGKDPFTGRDIMNEADPPARKAGALAAYLYDMAAPPPISTKGPLAKLLDAEGGTTDKYGYQKVMTGQAVASGLGFSYRSFDPELSRAENVARAMADMRKVQQRLRQRLQDQSLSAEQQERLVNEYVAEVERRQRQLERYIDETEAKRATGK